MQKTRATKFCTVAANICGSWGWNLLHATLLVPRIWRCLLDFWKVRAILVGTIRVLHFGGLVFGYTIRQYWPQPFIISHRVSWRKFLNFWTFIGWCWVRRITIFFSPCMWMPGSNRLRLLLPQFEINSACASKGKKVKCTPCTGTQSLYRPYGP